MEIRRITAKQINPGPRLPGARLPKVIAIVVTVLVIAVGITSGGAREAAETQPTFRTAIDIVRVPVTVVDRDGNLYADLDASAFKVFEDGQEREVVNFASSQESLTMVLLLEHSRLTQYLVGEILRPAAVFTTQIMERGDYAAIVAFDNRPHVLVDFTENRQQLLDAIGRMSRSPAGLSESNLFSAVRFALAGGVLENVEYKGLREVEGRTGLLVVASGLDTLSNITYDDIRRTAANSGVPVFTMGIGELAYIRAEPYLSGLQRLTFLQAQNQLRTLAQESGGRFYSVRFPAAVDRVLESIATMLRFQYTLGYRPAEQGKEKREIQVRVDVDGDGLADNDRLDLSHRRYFHTEKRGNP
jgi:VWFA-related protein